MVKALYIIRKTLRLEVLDKNVNVLITEAESPIIHDFDTLTSACDCSSNRSFYSVYSVN